MSNSYIDESVLLKRLNYLRGLFAIMIVIGHASAVMSNELLPFAIIHKLNMVSVGYFFLVSGWSLSYNYYHKDNYLMGFIKKKVLKLLLFSATSVLIAKILKLIVLKKQFTLNLDLILGYNWYIYEIIVFYILFYFTYKFIKNTKTRLFVIFSITLLVCIVTCYFSNKYTESFFWGHSYHFSSFCFLLGIIFNEYYKKLKLFFYDKRILFSIVCLLFTGISSICLKMPQGSFLGGIVLHNIVCMGLVSVLSIWGHHLNFVKIKCLKPLTKLSTEIYLYQFVVLEILEQVFFNNKIKIGVIYIFLVVIFDVFIAYIVNFAFGKLVKK